MHDGASKKPSRIQMRNRKLILDAALDVFSAHGYRGATLDQIAEAAGLSKPNILYYFAGKEEIHVTLLSQLMQTWLDPLIAMDESGDPMTELLAYVQRKLGIGCNKAGRLVEQMEDEGVVSAANHVGKREILVPEQH